MSKIKILILASLIGFSFSFLQAPFTVQSNTLTQDFPDYILFGLTLADADQVESIDLIYAVNGKSCQESVVRQPVDFESGSFVDASWEWELKRSGSLPPGVVVTWSWEITDQNGDAYLIPEEKYTVVDPYHDWQFFTDQGVTVQWYEAGAEFGEGIHQIAISSIERMEREIGIAPDENIKIIIYPSAKDVRDAVLLTPDWTGGIAFPEFNSTIIGIGTSEWDWANSVIPHELAHLAVDSFLFNCRGVFLPTWLSEGLAEVVEGSLDQVDLRRVLEALDTENLPRLSSLESGFSAFGDEARLSYAQSGFVTMYLIDTYGVEKLIEFLSSVKQGDSIDTALNETYGFDTDGLDVEWRNSLGYEADYAEDEKIDVTPTAVPTLALVLPSFQPTPPQIVAEEAAVTETSPVEPEETAEAMSEAADEAQPNEVAKPVNLFIYVFSGIVFALIALYFVYRRLRQ